MDSEKPMVSTGSMFNTSEGLFATGLLGTIAGVLKASEDWKVQLGCLIAATVIASVYISKRTSAKADSGE